MSTMNNNNRQSGSQLPIPVFPTPPPSRPKRRSRDRLSGLFSAAKTRRTTTTFSSAAPVVWRPSTTSARPSPPTPQWPLPRVPITIRDDNPALTRTYTRPRDAPRPPSPPRSSSSSELSGTSEADAATAAPLLGPTTPASPPRPPYFLINHNPSSFQTRYMNMALSIDKIPRSHNILANLFAWMVLVAFVLAPANFSSRSFIPSTPLLAVCLALLALGLLGHAWLRWVHRRNYIWLLNRLYLPLVLNALAGLLATLVLVDVQHGWAWGPAAIATVAVEGATLLASAAMFFYLDLVLLRQLKAEHVREMTATASRSNVVKRPPFAPGSVV